MRCRDCGHANPDDANFCGNCGSALATHVPCPNCGRENPADLRFCPGCGAQLAGDDEPGPASNGGGATAAPSNGGPGDGPAEIAGGRYVVRGFLGEGGRKRVYLAHDTSLERDVAIALVKTEGLDDAARERVRAEARAMARLGDHPAIVTVHDIGDEDGEPYIVSQYMAGGALERMLDQAPDRRLDPDEAIRIADCVASALEHAHEKGVIHRDLKPANVWLAEDGTAKLGDFGLAFSLDRSRMTRTGTIVGTVAYMAPEQALGRGPDASSDLYSLGAMLYEMLTGRPPFAGDSAVSVISQHTSAEPVAPSWHTPDVPRGLEEVVLRLLAKSPDERYPSATELREALRHARGAAESDRRHEIAVEANPMEGLAGGVFVGREREMERLLASLEDALAGRGSLVMLVGEPGIGKTRTAQELLTYARLRGARVLVGRSHEGEGAPAYWPWVQMARGYIEEKGAKDAAAEMGAGAADMAQVLPELREMIPGIAAADGPGDPEEARFRYFDSTATFLKNAARTEPLVLFLDDLHWADKPSLLFLQFLARELAGARILVLGTYRDVELSRRHPLSQVLADLAREGLIDRILLRGLTENDVARFVEMTASVQPPPRLVQAVHQETEGNPFFVSEIVNLLASEGRLDGGADLRDVVLTIPQGVREVVGRRLDQLSRECNFTLSAASVIGREFGLDVLDRVVCDEVIAEMPQHADKLSREQLLEVIDEAVRARVIAPTQGSVGRYTFSHALVREALYEELGVTRRVRLHRRVGEVIEELFDARRDEHLDELAHHFLEAQDLDKAVEYSIHAAGRAMALLAYEEGAKLYEQALQAMELRGGVGGQEQAELLLALGDAQARAGEPIAAKDTFYMAADAARAASADEQLARAALGLADRMTIGLVDEPLIALMEEALAGVPEEDSTMRARMLASLAMVTFFQSSERADALSREAIEMARRIDDPGALAAGLYARHFVLFEPEFLDERHQVVRELLESARAAGERDLAVEARGLLLVDLLESGDVRGAREEIEAFARGAAELRRPAYQRMVAIRRAMMALMEGRLDDVEPILAEHSLHADWGAVDPNLTQGAAVAIYELRRHQGRLEELAEAMAGLAAEYPAVPAWRCGLSLLFVSLGREDDARREMERVAVDNFAPLLADPNRLVGYSMLAQVAARLPDRPYGDQLYDLLLPYAHRNVVVGAGWACEGSAAAPLAELAAALGRYDDAERHFEEALRMNIALEGPPLVAETRMRYAAMLADRDRPDDRERALELVADSLDAAQQLGMSVLVERCFDLKLRLQGIDTADVQTSIDVVASAVEDERPDLSGAAAPDGTVTILFSDIEGSTEMTERLGDRRWLEVLREHNSLVRAEVRAHGGFEVKAQGDGFMVAFSSARRALDCAIAIQRGFAARAEDDSDAAIRVRIGMHTGEAIRERDDFFGRNVILAARIASQADGGEVLVSSLLKELTESSGDIAFGEAREVTLKGLSGSYRLHAVDWEGVGAGAG
ncbi:MAG TPA: protein kinase [Thermoleophilaceae bacterium]|nr:protein kinase [Thermoleophilaceae bacterium]